MHEDKLELVRTQIRALCQAVQARDIQAVYTVSCGGSLATLYPFAYLLPRETARVSTAAISANEFVHDPPCRLDEHTLVILNSQSGTTPETVRAAEAAAAAGALTAAYTTGTDSPIAHAVDCPIWYYDDPVDPYPLALSIFPIVYQTVFALLDVWNGTNRLPDMESAMQALEGVCSQAVAEHRAQARAFAQAHRTEPVIYTVSAGLDRSIAYILTNCSFMESVWKHSSPVHAGEFFHGACEAFGRETAVVAFLGLGKYRPVEERAVKFLQRITDKLTVLDAAALDLGALPAWTRPYVAPLVLHSLASEYCLQLSYAMGHPMSSRRYMGVQKF